MRLLIILALVLTGCATHHAPVTHPVNLGNSHWNCDITGDCYAEQEWEPSQLTPLGCALHKVVTFGHTAQECKKGK